MKGPSGPETRMPEQAYWSWTLPEAISHCLYLNTINGDPDFPSPRNSDFNVGVGHYEIRRADTALIADYYCVVFVPDSGKRPTKMRLLDNEWAHSFVFYYTKAERHKFQYG